MYSMYVFIIGKRTSSLYLVNEMPRSAQIPSKKRQDWWVNLPLVNQQQGSKMPRAHLSQYFTSPQKIKDGNLALSRWFDPPVLLNIFCLNNKREIHWDHHTSIFIVNWLICILTFADDIDLLAVTQDLANKLTDTS